MGIELTCVCCLISREFDDTEAVFRAGWDAPPHFSGPILCELCPSAPLALYGVNEGIAEHQECHALWEREGRPAKFSIETCVPEKLRDQAREGMKVMERVESRLFVALKKQDEDELVQIFREISPKLSEDTARDLAQTVVTGLEPDSEK